MTIRPSLNELIKKGESETVEFKKSLSLQDKGLESLCAMLNSDAGYGIIIFGVDSDGTVHGLEQGNLDTAQRSLSQKIDNKIDPRIVVKISFEELNGKCVLLLSAGRNKEVPYYEYDGRAWIRIGTENRLLNLSDKKQLERKRNRDTHPGPWKCDQCGSFVGILHSFVVTAEGMKKTYKCECGGEFWPIN